MLRKPFTGLCPADQIDRRRVSRSKFRNPGWSKKAVLAMPVSPIRDERRFIDAARHAARRAVDPSRLIEGEDLELPQPADARQWVTVYSELLTFKQKMLDHMYHDLQELSWPASREVRETDVPLIEGEQIRYQRRLRFWQARACQKTESDAFYSPFQPVDQEESVTAEDRDVIALHGERRQSWTPSEPAAT